MKLVTRSEWGARPPKSVTRLNGAIGVALHYEGPKMGEFPHSECAGKVRGIQIFHMRPGALGSPNGGSDIAYNFLVCPHGDIYEGRGLGVRSAANGTNYGNSNYIAVCGLWGKGDPFTDAAKDGFNAVIEFAQNHGVGKDVKPHQYFYSTECPGAPVVNWINTGRPGGTTEPYSVSVREIGDPDVAKALDYTNVTLGPDGKGWVWCDVPKAEVFGFVFQGSFPKEDGYWEIPNFGVQDRALEGHKSVIEIVGGSPGQVINFSVSVKE